MGSDQDGLPWQMRLHRALGWPAPCTDDDFVISADERQRRLTPRLDGRPTTHRRLADATMVHLPVHASWLNQIEIYFSVVQRKLLTPDNIADLDALAQR
jgi:hypothetical protein